MCSILAILDLPGDPDGYRVRALRLSRIQRHRGPDWSGIHATDHVVLAHERLAVVDPESGAQPLHGPDGATVLAVNGEIYNHEELRSGLKEPYPFRTASDCEVILALYRDRGPDFLADLNGIFAFVLHDRTRQRWIAARDPVGVVPLYMGWDEDGVLHLASEMKALVPVCPRVREFPPGHLLDSREGRLRPWGDPPWPPYEEVMADPADPGALVPALRAAVRRQLMSDVPFGVLLSGGLDSSIVAALAVEAGPAGQRVPSFSVGLRGSPDLAAARRVARHLGTDHHELHFTLQEGLDALPDVIRHLETYDVTTVRAATPMYLMARRIRARGVRMVLSGEGADEIFAGYLYFHRAPSARALHQETIRKLERLHLYDCLRANKAMAAWGVEARVPFLDLEFLDVAMRLDPALKTVPEDGLEKELLRDAFGHLLPGSVARRQKEQFSDGVGYGWIDALRDHAAEEVSDAELARAAEHFPVNPPTTKEAHLYRAVFREWFPGPSAAACVPAGDSVACSTPEALAWDPELAAHPDPSGRAVKGVHRRAY